MLEIEDITLHVDVVTTLGLLVNELLSNALKHAFKGKDEGQVIIQINRNDIGLLLMLEDNGVGMASNGQNQTSGGLGFQFIEVFVAQLEASIQTDHQQGTRFSIQIPKAKLI